MFARAAHCDVTPRDRPVRLAGFAARERPVSEVLDGIEISALLLEGGARRCLMLAFDLMIVGKELADLVHSRLGKLGFRTDEVMMLASHTHCAPATDLACARLGTPDPQFIQDSAAAVETLVGRILGEQPREIVLEVFRGNLDHSINRRRYWPFPTYDRTQGLQWASVTFSPYPAGPRDEQATVILVRAADDRAPLAAFSHYTCHPTSMIPNEVISADYPGAIRGLLRATLWRNPLPVRAGILWRHHPAPRSLGTTPNSRRALRQVQAHSHRRLYGPVSHLVRLGGVA